MKPERWLSTACLMSAVEITFGSNVVISTAFGLAAMANSCLLTAGNSEEYRVLGMRALLF